MDIDTKIIYQTSLLLYPLQYIEQVCISFLPNPDVYDSNMSLKFRYIFFQLPAEESNCAGVLSWARDLALLKLDSTSQLLGGKYTMS